MPTAPVPAQGTDAQGTNSDPTTATDSLPLQLDHAPSISSQPQPVQAREADTSNSTATSGMISGSLTLDTSILDQLHSYTIYVTEDVNQNANPTQAKTPFHLRRTFPIDLSLGTPHFDLENIPFSRHPYRVRVMAAGLNGTEQRVSLQAHNPIADVNLGIMPGVIYSILLRDQRLNPRANLPVLMASSPKSGGRNSYFGTSNGFGVVLLEGVLAGEYQIFVGPQNAPLNQDTTVQVLAQNAVMHKGRPSHQAVTVEVPIGQKMTVEVTTQYAYAIKDADLKIYQLETSNYYSFKGKTDEAGRHTFPPLPDGTYQLDVSHPKYNRRSKRLKIKEGEPIPLIKVQLAE